MTHIVWSMSQGDKAVSSQENKYLIFKLGNEEFGVSIIKVKEIISMIPISGTPYTPDYVKGVISLHGKVSPVVDLRQKFGMKEAAYTDRTRIIIVEIANRFQKVVIGLIVDSVSEVMNIKNENIEATHGFGADLNMEFIMGIAKMGGLVKILLNIDRAFNTDEIAVSNPNEANGAAMN